MPGQGDKTAAIARQPSLKGRLVGVLHACGPVEIVHAGAPQPAVRQRKTGRMDDVDRHGETGAQAQDGAGIGGDVGLVKGKTDHAGREYGSFTGWR